MCGNSTVKACMPPMASSQNNTEIKKAQLYKLGFLFGGEGEIRTHEPRKGPPVFKTGAFNRSATSPILIISTCGYAGARLYTSRDSSKNGFTS